MKIVTGIFFAATLAIGSLSSSLFAAEGSNASCKNGAMIRTVTIGTIDAAQPNSCTVSYSKETETPGATQILWQSKNDKNYCDDKAKSFVTKLTTMGWTCEGDLASGSVTESMPAK